MTMTLVYSGRTCMQQPSKHIFLKLSQKWKTGGKTRALRAVFVIAASGLLVYPSVYLRFINNNTARRKGNWETPVDLIFLK